MPQLSIATLGTLQIALDGATAAFDYAKVRALLLYLAVEQHRPHTRDALAELLWPEQEPGTGRNNLRRALAALRASIGDHAADPPFLLAERETVQFNPRADHSLDSARFTALVERVARHAHPRGQACPACQASLEEAVALYRGPFAEGALPRGCPELEAWALARREWFERHALDALDALAALYAAQGRHDQALACAQAQLAIDAWREPAHRQAMRALASQGLRGAALAQYEQCARLLAAELGAEPEPATTALAEAIRRNELGGRVEAPLVPQPAPQAPQPASPGNLSAPPAPATSLIGRDDERGELAALIADPACRLLSLLGPGGIGKTRLALQLAEDVGARSVEGMPLALELAAAASRDRSFVAIAEALARNLDLLRTSLRDVPARHRSVRAAIDHSWQLLDAPQRRALALLGLFRGGFTPEAAARVAGADEELLASLQDKSLLRSAGGRYTMHELVRQFAASQLLESGAAEAGHLAYLDYMAALAEAAEPELLGAAQAQWLERLEAEHANFRAALRWAIDSGASEGAARVAGALWRFWWMRGHLAEGRRWLDEILAQPGQITPAVLARAARGAGSLANQQGDYQRARDHHSAALELERRAGNRRGLANQLGSLARVETNLRNYDRARALIAEGLEIHRELGNEVGYALLTDALAGVAYNEGDSAEAAQLYTEALALHRARGDRHSIAIGLHNLSDLAYERGDLGQALTGARECLALFRELGHTLGVGAALHLIAAVGRIEGDDAQAWAAEGEALELYYGIGNWRIVAICLVGAAAIAARQGRWELAAQLCGAADQLLGAGELPVSDRSLYAETLAGTIAILGAEGAARAAGAGRALGAEAAVALARAAA